MMAKKAHFVENIPCGNTCALVGVDIRMMIYTVSPVVKVAVSAKKP